MSAQAMKNEMTIKGKGGVVTTIKKRKPRSDKGKGRKKASPKALAVSDAQVSDSDEESKPVGSDLCDTTPEVSEQESEDENGSSATPVIIPPAVVMVVEDNVEATDGLEVASVEATETANSSVSSSSIVNAKVAKKGSKYTEEEVTAVRLITGPNPDKVVLNNKQLEISKWIEAQDVKVRNAERKLSGMPSMKSDKASFCMEASFDRAFFLELQNQYKQEDGEVYTLQAFQHAINTWFFNHINQGNAYARSGGYKRQHVGKTGNTKVVGVDIPNAWFKTQGGGFLQGYLISDEGKAQMEIGEDLQRIKRTANKSAKGVKETKEQRARNLEQSMAEADDDELELLMARIQKTKLARAQAKERAGQTTTEDESE